MDDSKKRQFRKEQAAFLYCRDLNERELLDLLGHRNSYIRTAAVNKLQIQGPGGAMLRCGCGDFQTARPGSNSIALSPSNAGLTDHMIELCSARDYRLRSSGAAVLASLTIGSKEKLERVINILSFFALNDSSKEVRISAIYALGYRYSLERKYHGFIFSILARTAKDADAALRLAGTHALSNVREKKMIPVVEKLLRDQDKHVRDWTAFYVKNSEYSGFDSEGIRGGLVAMLDDEYDDARAEAVCSLAFLRDRRALPALHRELDVDAESIKDIMAEAAADLGDASLLPNLEVWDQRFPNDQHIRTQLRRLQSPGGAMLRRSSGDIQTTQPSSNFIVSSPIKVGQAKRDKKSGADSNEDR